MQKNEEAVPSSNGKAHALTSSHYTAAGSSDSACQGTTEQQGSAAATEATEASTAAAATEAAAAAAAAAAAKTQAATATRQDSAAVRARDRLQGLLEVYEEPDSHAGLYNYAKALEDVEAGLLAGFFYKHFSLASNVIGSESKGKAFFACLLTMQCLTCSSALHLQVHAGYLVSCALMLCCLACMHCFIAALWCSSSSTVTHW